MTAPETNPFIQNPFRPLDINLQQYDPVSVEQVLLDVSNAIDHFMDLSNQNYQLVIDCSDNKKGEDYKVANKRRYDLNDRIESLKNKKGTLDSLFYKKNAEMKHVNGSRSWIKQ